MVQINIPPLRNRQEDIPLFVKHYLDEFSKKNHKSVASISEEALGMLCSYEWPGNVRELRNCIERMVVLSRNDILNAHDVPTAIKLKTGVLGGNHVPASSLDLTKNERHLILKALSECEGNRTRAAEKLGISRRTLHRKINEYKIAE